MSLNGRGSAGLDQRSWWRSVNETGLTILGEGCGDIGQSHLRGDNGIDLSSGDGAWMLDTANSIGRDIPEWPPL